MDESRMGLIPILRKIWSPIGQRPVIEVKPKYDWIYVFSAIEPTSGDNFSLICESVCLEMMQYWIDEFSKILADDEICLLTMDQAGWHTEKGLKVPKNIIILYQPAYSPECNPTERLWTWVKERLANKIFENKENLINNVIKILNDLDKYKSILKKWVCYSWWKDAVDSKNF
jgi:transposase